MKRCIYHYPNPINDNTANVGSAIRPNQMLNAFRKIGYEVEVVTGYRKKKKKKIQEVIKKIDKKR